MSNSLTLGKKALTLVVVSATILWTLGVAAFAVPQTASAATPGSVIKGTSLSTVYYYGTDGQRYVFPNSKVYFTWYPDFSGVQTISDSELAAIPLSSEGNVVYRAGSRWVKVQSDPKTYAVTPNGSLRWIESETVAQSLGGSAWNTLIDDVPDLFFSDYTVGSSLMTAAAYEGMYATMGGNNYVVVGGEKRMVTSAGMSANRIQSRFYLSPGSDLLSSLTAGADVTSKLNVLADPAQLGDSDVTPVAGGLTVSLASDTPASTTIADGASLVNMMKVRLTANSGDANVTALKFTMGGLSTAAAISNVYLYEGNNRLTNARSVNTTTRQATFSGLTLAVASGQARTLTLVADMANGANLGGSTVQFQLATVADVESNATVSGSFPVNGNTMEMSNTDVAEITVTDTGSLSNPKIGEVAKIANFTIAESASAEDLLFESLRLEVDRASDHSQYELRRTGTVLATGVVSGSSYVDFTLVSPFTIPEGGSREFEVWAKVGGENAELISTRIEESSDLRMRGSDFGFYATMASNGFNASLASTCTSNGTSYDCVTIQAGQLTFAFNGPTTQDIGQDLLGVVLWEGAVTAANQVDLRDMDFAIAGDDLETGTADQGNFLNFRVVRKDTGATLMGPNDFDAGLTDSVGTVQFTDDFTLVTGQSLDIQLLVDVKNATSPYTLAGGETISATLTAASIVARDTNNDTLTLGTDIIPSSDLAGNTMTVRAPSLTVSIASNPASSTYVRGTNNVDMSGFSFQAGTASAIDISSVTFAGVMDDDATVDGTGDVTVQDKISSCSIYDSLTGALIDGPESFATGLAPDISFSGFIWTVPAGQTYRMILRCNLANVAPASSTNDSFYVEIDDDSDISAVDEDGNTVAAADAAGTTLSSSNEENDDGGSVFQTIANAGTLTIAIDGDSPNSTIVLSNSTGVTTAKYKFTSSNEAFTVDRLQVDNTGGSDTTVASIELHYENAAGESKVATGFLTSGTYRFEGLSIYVPKDDDAVVTIKINTGEVSAANTGSGDIVDLELSNDDTNDDEFRAVGSGSGSTLNDSSTTVDASFTGSGDGVIGANAHEIRKTKPTISLASGSPSGAAIVGLIEVLRFNVTADSRGDVTVEELAFQVSSTDTATSSWNVCDTDGTTNFIASDVYLYDASDLSTDIADDADVALYTIAGAACGTSTTAATGYIGLDFSGSTTNGSETVSAGTTKTYILKLNVLNSTGVPSAVQDDSMRVDMPDENALDGVVSSALDAITWVDSNTSGADVDADGTGGIDGEYIKNLPIIGGSLIF